MDHSTAEDETCPICLNDMAAYDHEHPIKCPNSECSFNFCINCLTSLLSSSKDDYEMASDGNRHVKVHLNCPNCRADISDTIEGTIIDRRKALSNELCKVAGKSAFVLFLAFNSVCLIYVMISIPSLIALVNVMH